MPAEHTLWLYVGAMAAFLVAWINGANNAGNAIGAVVGAKIVSVRRALLMASIFDLFGAIVFGEFISVTLMKGIVDPSKVEKPDLLLYGMCSALFATFFWAFVSTLLRVPMSISQAMVGGILGFGIATIGFKSISWRKVAEIVASWAYLPFMSMVVSVALYKLYSYLVKRSTRLKLMLLSSILMFLTLFTTIFLLLVKSAEINKLAYTLTVSTKLSLALTFIYILYAYFKIPRENIDEARKEVSKHLLISSCMAMAFSHGAHDVANAAGPLATILYTVENGHPPGPDTPVPLSAIVLSAVGIATGILVWGYRILETIGERITPLTPETGFIAQLSGALTVLIITRLGLPTSTTVAIVGAVAGVGIARGVEYLNLRMLLRIIAMWSIGFPLVTLISALMVTVYMYLAV